MRNDYTSTKIQIRDDEGAEIAYATGGAVYAAATGKKIANLRNGSLYALDGQIFGLLTPSGAVRGDAADAFMRLAKKGRPSVPGHLLPVSRPIMLGSRNALRGGPQSSDRLLSLVRR
jgi:hypothetical protein